MVMRGFRRQDNYMKQNFFALSSLTYAYKAKDALDSRGIRSDIIRLSGYETSKGCRYGIEVSGAEYSRAKRVIKSAGIPFTEPP